MDSRQVGLTGPTDSQSIAVFRAPTAPAVSGNSAFSQLVQANQVDAASSAHGVTISAHAQDRLRVRNITLNDDDMKKIATTMDRVAEKGGRQSLFLVKTSSGQDAAMVVSVRNRVVITAVDGNSLRDNLFTNIDSAAIVH